MTIFESQDTAKLIRLCETSYNDEEQIFIGERAQNSTDFLGYFCLVKDRLSNYVFKL